MVPTKIGPDVKRPTRECDLRATFILPPPPPPPHGSTAPCEPGPPHCRSFTITLRHTTVGRTPLDESSARRRNHDLTIYKTHKRRRCPRRDLNSQSWQTSGRRPTPYTTRPLGSACTTNTDEYYYLLENYTVYSYVYHTTRRHTHEYNSSTQPRESSKYHRN